jgi:hypothetical protein
VAFYPNELEVQPLDMVDNSINPCERISGWLSFHVTLQAGHFILSFPTQPVFIFTEPPTVILRGVFSLQWLSNG